ncbi:methionine biosynthesis PLP-dependent protein [Rummeliibacillus sp. TYF005]|uniref:methionine biosynthesis PLP-dependent protein n=1 Tax=Rummeliibacillus sp. TYF005 TaxID=2058214 RepID=UPI000F53DDAC|nr:methionine biosynthesis PLP-dependent protein [Rummeliibacillus sp. TYF005]RPJ94015.1 methionine biosynthesis PLP-dependent protein [Rummeliibacillus sp. TYF005]
MTKKHISTRLAQIGTETDPRTGAINTPIYLSTAYRHAGLGQSTGYDYTRTKNPTRAVLEEGITALESGDAGFACSSGMAAIQLVLSLFKSGDEIIYSDDIYGGTYRLARQYEEQYGIHAHFTPFQSIAEVEAIINEHTKALFIESPTNPLMQEINIELFAKLAKKNHLLLIVDNTFLTPYYQRPIELGADIVIHSATKYIGGHNDVLAGLVVAKGEELCERLLHNHNASGATLAPIDSWLLLRGLKTLHVRMKQHTENARKIVDYLSKEPSVKDVLYTGLGGMISFRLHHSELVPAFLQNLKLIAFAESLGGVESFITYPATQTHADIPEEERTARGVDNSLLRFSVGIEEAEDLIEDLQQVFTTINKEVSFHESTK